jgi:hypothetical protein
MRDTFRRFLARPFTVCSSEEKADILYSMKFVFAFVLICAAALAFTQTPAAPAPAGTAAPGTAAEAVTAGADESGLPRTFRKLSLGMSLDELKAALTADELFAFRGDRDVSFLPVKEENLVETTGISFIRRAFFQLRDGAVFIMAFSLDPAMIDHYSVFTTLRNKHGDPNSLSPSEAVWENGETRVSLERPLTVKYIDMQVFNRIVGDAKAQEAAEVFRRQGFLNEF